MNFKRHDSPQFSKSVFSFLDQGDHKTVEVTKDGSREGSSYFSIDFLFTIATLCERYMFWQIATKIHMMKDSDYFYSPVFRKTSHLAKSAAKQFYCLFQLNKSFCVL